MRPSSVLAFALAVAVPFSSAVAQEMYSWKDSKGVTQYSDTPPAAGKYDTRKMAKDVEPSKTGTTADAAEKATASNESKQPGQEDPRCATARQNLALLESKNSIQMAAGNDGKPGKTLDADERAKHLELAQASLKAYDCKQPAPKR